MVSPPLHQILLYTRNILHQFTNLRLRVLFCFFVLGLSVWALTPYDNSVYLALRWNKGVVDRRIRYNINGRLLRLVSGSPNYMVQEGDVGTIINTGFAKRERLRAHLDVLGAGKSVDNVVVVADYDTHETGGLNFKGTKIAVHDALSALLELKEAFHSDRMQKYLDFKAELISGNRSEAERMSREVGYELDIMKHVPGLEIGYKLMPSRKWYIMTDDDTYIHTPSLLALLSTLSHKQKYYLGNAVGSYQTRFGHGGSAIVFSAAAMHHIFKKNEKFVRKAKIDSLTHQLGDEIVARMALRAGVFLDERFSLHFGGEMPNMSAVRANRVCAATISFHELEAGDFTEISGRLGGLNRPVRWGELWKLFDGVEEGLKKRKWGWDFVGKPDETVQVFTLGSDIACKEKCWKMREGKGYLAWSFEEGSGRCLLSPWYMIGERKKGYITGLEVDRIQQLMGQCID